MLILLSILSILLQQPSPQDRGYLGAAACGACHPAELGEQSATGHARALQPATSHRLVESFALDRPVGRGGRFELRLLGDAAALRFRVSDGSKALETAVEWAFGSGGHAVTFIGRLDQDSYLEHYLSYYPAGRVLDATPGHALLRPRSLEDARGVRYRTFDPDAAILRCFRCHSTGPLDLDRELAIRPTETGVRCEACHGPGRGHAEAAGRGEVDRARALVRDPRTLGPAALNDLCGACHRKPAPAGAATNWNDPWNVRHQPLYLARSACFRRSGRLTCLTCHEPHRPLRRSEPAFYNERCAACHRDRPHPRVASALGLQNCIECHMPAVEPRPYLRFVNHRIGVFRRGSPLVPAR